jgi:hypothetical protein
MWRVIIPYNTKKLKISQGLGDPSSAPYASSTENDRQTGMKTLFLRRTGAGPEVDTTGVDDACSAST